MEPRYLVDSNIVITGFHTYPRDVFPGYWRFLERLKASGRLLLCNAVRDEIVPRGDDASVWVAEQFASHEVLSQEPETLEHYQAVMGWAAERTNPSFTPEALRTFAEWANADAWLVAYAKEHSLVALTNETSSPHKSTNVKLPDAAMAQEVECISMLDLFRRESITF